MKVIYYVKGSLSFSSIHFTMIVASCFSLHFWTWWIHI